MTPQLQHNESKTALPVVETGSREFLTDILDNVTNAPSTRVRVQLMKAARRDLMRISESDANIGGAPVFTSFFITCQLLVQKILEERFSPLSTYEPNTILKLLQISLQ